MSCARVLGIVVVATSSLVWAGGCAKEKSSAEFQCPQSTELCNQTDDDCDGLTDEAEDGTPMTRSCANGCGEGLETCEDGEWVGCTAPSKSTEVCNGKDDDCDGVADNGFDCAEGKQRPCGIDVGACHTGTETCSGSCEWSACKGDIEPSEEVCDGVEDEDCDGTVDNGCSCEEGETKTCCGGTTIECVNGVWPSCPPAPTELCNGLDDDCSGVVDDHLSTAPFMVDEDDTGLDDCDHAYTEEFLTPIIENAAAKKYSFHLAKADGGTDRDYFSFITSESSDAECVANPSYNECYLLTVALVSEPGGADLELCVYDVGSPGPSTACSNYDAKGCSNDGTNWENEVQLSLAGGCGNDDARRYVVEVFGAPGSASSCEAYEFTVELTGTGPQPDTCWF